MRTLIIAVIFFVFSNCFSQDKEEYSKWNISVNGGIIYFLDDGVYHPIKEGYYYDLYKSTSSYIHYDYSFNHYEGTISYFFNRNHELGITFGREDFTYKERFLHVGSPFWEIDTTAEIFDGYSAYGLDLWGIFYNFHYKDYLYGGIKLAFGDDAYECFLVGKKFNLKDSFFLKTEISYSFLNSDYIWNFSSARSEKITLSFGLGLNL